MRRRHFSTIFSLLLLCLLSLASVHAAAPAAPSDLKVTVLGVNTFLVEWKDNSLDETGWEIRIGLKSSKPPPRFLMIPTGNIPDVLGATTKSYFIVTNNLPGKELNFQMTSYNGLTGFEVFSAPTAVVTVRALSPTTFAPPTKLTAKVIDERQIKFAWTDNSTSEHGYQLEYKKGNGKWAVLASFRTSLSYKYQLSLKDPTATYSFRVRAYRENPVAFTAFSNIVTVTTKAFVAPATLVAKVEPEGAFSFTWKDRSSIEEGYEIQWKVGTGEFASLATVSENGSSTGLISGFSLDTDYQFRMRGYRTVNKVKVYTGFSNVSSVKSSSLAKPTDLTVDTTTDTTIKLKWADNSSREYGYQIQRRLVGAETFETIGTAGTSAKEYTATGLAPGQSYEFRVRAYESVYSEFSNTVQGSTKQGLLGNLNPPISLGNQFLYQIQVSQSATLTGITVTGLPEGLTYNSTLHTISGYLANAGTYNVTITATFSDGSTSVRTLVLKSVGGAPVASQTFAAVSVPAATSKTVSVTDKFTDADTLSAARFETTSGQFDIILFPLSTPKTVDNFLDYVDAGSYDNSFFHRSPANFVVQGGGYTHTAADGFAKIPHFDAVQNEPGLSNVRGTVAMAKIGGLPDSATSEWFVNVNNNSANLDFQNGGFTVFGRVPDKGMIVVDKINGLPVNDYNINIGANVQPLTDVPIDDTTAPSTLDPAKLVKILSVGAAPILTYEVLSQDTAVATATLTGTDISITGVATGTTTVDVKATDLDGNSVTQSIAVTVP